METVKKQGWINIWLLNDGTLQLSQRPYNTKEEALQGVYIPFVRLDTIQIEWNGK